MANTLARWAAKERQRRGWSLREAGEKVGVSYVTIWRIEQGQLTALDLRMLEGLSSAYEMPIGDVAELAVGKKRRRK